jgi:hypothetical protein
MSRHYLKIAIFWILVAIVFVGCKPDLIPSNPKPDLGNAGFCHKDDQGRLLIMVKNQGDTDAPASTTTVDFFSFGSFDLPTPPIPAGGSVTLPALNIPAGCYDPDCNFKITVDSKNQVKESNESNNQVASNCLG